jgi:hypothetical protein
MQGHAGTTKRCRQCGCQSADAQHAGYANKPPPAKDSSIHIALLADAVTTHLFATASVRVLLYSDLVCKCDDRPLSCMLTLLHSDPAAAAAVRAACGQLSPEA